MPRPASGSWSYNSGPSIQDNLVTVGARQYAVWVDADRNPVIARRDGTEEWQTYGLSGIEGNPLRAPTAQDGHNFYSMAVDADGYIHLAGNHHVDSLRYVRSQSPHAIKAWVTQPMVGRDEDAVTYPLFFQLPDGTLFFLYRNGDPGDGDTFLDRYDTRTKTWSRVHKMIDGRSSDLSFYPNHVSTRDGSIHIMGVWRGSSAANTNRDVTYLRSDDRGKSWVAADGTPLRLPLSHDTTPIAVPTSPEGSGLLNGGGLEVDDAGRPHGALMMYDKRGRTQQFHIWHDGVTWHVDAITRLTHRMAFNGGYTDGSVGRAAVVTGGGGGVFVLYTARELGDVLRVVEVTPGKPPCEFTLRQPSSIGAWTPVFDTQGLYSADTLKMLVVPTRNPRRDGSSSETASVDATLVATPVDALVREARTCRDQPRERY